ncbi:putative bromodomain-containing protein 10 [Genypterus blacodes]|uniref:putative bromodomain-containing protein 10 n=1 Tax=Genypterus blacodes TaxID=154954 RepID=UPI003F75A825
MDQEDITDQITAACSQHTNKMFSDSRSMTGSTEGSDLVISEEGLMANGTFDVDTVIALHCAGDSGDVIADGDHLALSNDGMSEFSNSDLSLPEVCISTNSTSFEEDMSYEVQQAYRIFTGFLLDKHKGFTGPFLYPIGHQETQRGVGGVRSRAQSQLRQSMCLKRMEEKFTGQEYETITQFVADFRLMLENCYRYHGVDHWISKQAQKLEVMLEQKLTLLSRTLREKTTLAVTSKGRFGAEEERSSGGTSTRRRSAPRSLVITVGGHESVMVQTLRLEEQQRAKEEKRQRELEKKEAEEMSAKEVEEWEESLLSQALPHSIDTLWELPAIGHFLCLAQTALNLPEIIFFELERCLLMPRCSLLLSKIMSSLLSPPQRRATLHRRPALPYRRWESELRQRVMGWYRAVGASHDQPSRAEQLGLCFKLFSVLGEVSPLEEKPFHLLPFYQRIWLLKGMCDHVYETQKDVQDALLAQPIHECRESILGYDSKENAYIHFPHFCGADLRIYCQSPSTPPDFPFPSVLVKKVEVEPATEGEESDRIKDEEDNYHSRCYEGSMATGQSEDGTERAERLGVFKRENGDGGEEKEIFISWSLKKEDESDSGSSDEGDSSEDSKSNLKVHTNSLSYSHLKSPIGGSRERMSLKEETAKLEHQSKRLVSKEDQCLSLGSVRTIKAETREPCLSVGEHSYTGRSPARSMSQASPTGLAEVKMDGVIPSQGLQQSPCLEWCRSNAGSVKSECYCGTSGPATPSLPQSTQSSTEESVNDKIRTKKKKRKKKREREQLRVKGGSRQLQHGDRTKLCSPKAAKSAKRRAEATTKKTKDKRKKHKTGKKLESSKKIKDETLVDPSFKLVCTSLEHLRGLISKTEDELDDLESTKKRLGRWYARREAVKDLHSTLIRLLNELLPWEPKLVKAHQRNRLRLKKESDDFKKHPDYNNFVREECISSSSSSSDDEEKGLGKEACSPSDHFQGSEEEDPEHVVPRGLWTGASTREFGQRVMTYVTLNNLSRVETGSCNITLSPDTGLESRSVLDPSNHSRDSKSAQATSMPAQASPAHRPTILHPTSGLPKGYTPIPTLLAKSVGNKVTLMKRPADCQGARNLDRQSKGSVALMPTSVVATTKPSKAQSSPSISQQNSPQIQTHGPQQTHALRQPVLASVTAALPKQPQAKLTQTVPKNPSQVVYKVPEGLGHLVSKDNNSPIKISVQPVVDQNTGEKLMQQVLILPSNLLIQKTEDKSPLLQQHQSKGIQAPISKVTGPLYMSTNVPGFTIPENKIPVQQVAPLNDARTARTPSPSVSPCLQQVNLNATGFKGAQTISPRAPTTPQAVMPNSPITTPASAVSTEHVKPTNPKQELKTVCIRDSQSILVTTRGGNTGIVKVQASSDHSALGSLPSSPVITISPQFKAFLVSNSSPAVCPPPSYTPPCTVPAATNISVAQAQKQASSLLKSSSTVTAPKVTAVTGNIPFVVAGNHTAGATVPFSQSYNTLAGPKVAAKTGKAAQTAAAGSQLHGSLKENTVIVPSLSSSGVPQVPTKAEFISKPGVKRAHPDERSQVTKFILFSPSSSSTSSHIAVTKETSPTTPLPCSRVMFISQPTAASSTTIMGSIGMPAPGSVGKPTTSLSSQALSSNFGQPVSGVNLEALSKGKNITLPTGVQFQLSGQTTGVGQMRSVPVSDSCSQTAAYTGVVQGASSKAVVSCPVQPVSQSSLTTRCQLQGAPITTFPQPGSYTSTTTTGTLSLGSIINKDLNLSTGVLPNSPAQCINKSIPAKTTTLSLVCQSPHFQSGFGGETSVISSSQHAPINTQIPVSSVRPNNVFGNANPSSATPVSTCAPTGPIQQRIVINTSAPLAAGTQILLNNARFVVPPQGLGPGSHVLIISSPAPQEVPSTSVTSTTATLPPLVAPRTPVLPQLSPVRLPAVSAMGSPIVSCTTAAGSPVPASGPNVTPVGLTGTPVRGSPLLSTTTNVVSAVSRLTASQVTSQAGHHASPFAGAPPLLSAQPRLGSTAALVSPVATSTATCSSALATAASASSFPLTSPLSRFSAPSSSSSVLLNPSAVALPTPVGPALASLSSVSVPVSAVMTCTPAMNSPLPTQQMIPIPTPVPCRQPQQRAPGMAVTSTSPPRPSLHTGLCHTSVRQQMPAIMQPVVAGTQTQVLPTAAVPSIVSTTSRVQMLPIATVPPIGNTVNSMEAATMVTVAPSSSTAIIPPPQPVGVLNTNTTHPPVLVASQALGKPTSALGVHNTITSKILISPDGAVLSTVQCPIDPAGLADSNQLAAPLVSASTSTGATTTATTHTHDSSLQPSKADTNPEPIN